MDIRQARAYVETMQATVNDLRRALGVATTTVRVGQSLQAAIDAADVDATIQIEPGIYDGAIYCRRPITIMPTTPVAAGRATAKGSSVTLTSNADTISILGPGVTLRGLTVRSTAPSHGLVRVLGERAMLSGLTLLGDPLKGQHRGIEANAAGTIVTGCYVDDCWLVGQDAQALSGWSGTRGLLVDDCYLAGGAETVMFGGADSTSADTMPTDITIQGSTLTKNPAWYALNASIKNCFELKAARNVKVVKCQLQYAGTSGGQSGFIVVLTPRNQDGKAPWSCVENVLIDDCDAAFGGSGVAFSGSDNLQPSGALSGVTIRKCRFTELDPLGITKGSGRVMQFMRTPKQIVVEGCEFDGRNLSSGAYFMDAAPTGLVLRDTHFPASKYPFKVDGGGSGLAAVRAYAPDAVLSGLAVNGILA